MGLVLSHARASSIPRQGTWPGGRLVFLSLTLPFPSSLSENKIILFKKFYINDLHSLSPFNYYTASCFLIKVSLKCYQQRLSTLWPLLIVKGSAHKLQELWNPLEANSLPLRRKNWSSEWWSDLSHQLEAEQRQICLQGKPFAPSSSQVRGCSGTLLACPISL